MRASSLYMKNRYGFWIIPSSSFYMKRFMLFFALIAIGVKGFTQVTVSIQTPEKDNVICLCCGLSESTRQPLWVVNGKLVSQINILTLNPNYITDVIVLKGSDALNKYGTIAKNGVVKVILKKNIKLQSVNKILAKNKIDFKSRKLPVYSNNTLIVGDSIFLPSDKRIEVLIIEANLNPGNRRPFNGKYLTITEN